MVKAQRRHEAQAKQTNQYYIGLRIEQLAQLADQGDAQARDMLHQLQSYKEENRDQRKRKSPLIPTTVPK
jgi:hypothetical protein